MLKRGCDVNLHIIVSGLLSLLWPLRLPDNFDDIVWDHFVLKFYRFLEVFNGFKISDVFASETNTKP